MLAYSNITKLLINKQIFEASLNKFNFYCTFMGKRKDFYFIYLSVLVLAILLLSGLTFSKFISLPLNIVKPASAMKNNSDCPDFWIGDDCHKGGGNKGGGACDGPDASFIKSCNKGGGNKGGGACDGPDASFIKSCNKGGGNKGGQTGGGPKCHDHCKSGKHKGDDKPPKANPGSSISPPSGPVPPPGSSTPTPNSDPSAAPFIAFLMLLAFSVVAAIVWKVARHKKKRDYERKLSSTYSYNNTHQAIIGVVTKSGIKI
jgi:hypothetical protein